MAHHARYLCSLTTLWCSSRLVPWVVKEDLPNVGLDTVGSIGRITIRRVGCVEVNRQVTGWTEANQIDVPGATIRGVLDAVSVNLSTILKAIDDCERGHRTKLISESIVGFQHDVGHACVPLCIV